MPVLGPTRTEQAGQLIRFALPAALFCGHYLLKGVTLPSALPRPLLQQAAALGLCAAGIFAEKQCDYASDDQSASLRIGELSTGVATALALTSLIAMSRNGGSFERLSGFAACSGVALWGGYESLQSEIKGSEGREKYGRLAHFFAGLAATYTLIEQPPLYMGVVRATIDEPFQRAWLSSPATSIAYCSYLTAGLAGIELVNEMAGDEKASSHLQPLIFGSAAALLPIAVSGLALPLRLAKRNLHQSSAVLNSAVLTYGTYRLFENSKSETASA